MGERFDGHAIERSQGTPTTAGSDIAGSLAEHVEQPRLGPLDDPEGYEYRVVWRDGDEGPWHLVVTERGNGRPFRSRGAARGVKTREENDWGRSKEYWSGPIPDRKWLVQRRPTEANWETIDGPGR